MNYLNKILTYDELKDVLFSVEHAEEKKIVLNNFVFSFIYVNYWSLE